MSAVVLGGVVAVAIAAAPSFTWVRTSTSTGAATVMGPRVSAASDGTAVATGDFYGTGVDLGDGVNRTSGASGTRSSAYIQRIGATGSVMWARSSTGTGTGQVVSGGVASHPDGSSVAVGRFQGSSVDLGDGVARSAGVPSGFTERFTADGTVAWVSTTSNGSVGNNAAGATPDGGTLVVGGVGGVNVDVGGGVLLTSANGGGAGSVLIEKFAANGTVSWARASGSTGASNAQGTSVSAFPDGTAVVTGTFQGTAVDLGDGVIRTSGNAGAENTIFVQRIAGNGSIMWAYTSSATGSNFVTGQGVSALPDGTSVVTGYFSGSGVDFGDGVVRASARGGLDSSMFTVRLRADGTVMWVRTSGATGASGVDGQGVVGRPDGSVVTVGWFAGAAVDLGDGVMRTSAAGGTEASSFTVSFAADGTAQWVVVSSGGVGVGSNVSTGSVAALPGNGILVGGSYVGSAIDLGDGIARTSPNGGGARAAFVATIGGAPATSGSTTPESDANPAAGTAARLTARLRCARGTCITTGTTPTGTVAVRQAATRRTTGTSRPQATARPEANGRCRTRGGTYRCEVTLTPGTWSVTTTARGTAGTAIARVVTRARVARSRLPAVTG